MKFKRHSNVDGIKQESVIVVESILGMGTETDPVRKIREYFLIDGTLLARVDGKYKPLEIGEWTEDKDTVYEVSKDK